MTKRPSNRDGCGTICLKCFAEYQYKRKHGITNDMSGKSRQEINSQSKANQAMNEEESCKEILTILGYDLAGEISVHEQFMKRHYLVD